MAGLLGDEHHDWKVVEQVTTPPRIISVHEAGVHMTGHVTVVITTYRCSLCSRQERCSSAPPADECPGAVARNVLES